MQISRTIQPGQRLTAFWSHVEQEILPKAITLYGAGGESAELRGQIEKAVRWATDNGKKLR